MSQDPIKTRLRRIEGQVQGVQRMLDDDRSCDQVLTQLLAVRSAVEQACLAMTEDHLRERVLRDEGADAETLNEIMQTMRLVLRASGSGSRSS